MFLCHDGKLWFQLATFWRLNLRLFAVEWHSCEMCLRYGMRSLGRRACKILIGFNECLPSDRQFSGPCSHLAPAWCQGPPDSLAPSSEPPALSQEALGIVDNSASFQTYESYDTHWYKLIDWLDISTWCFALLCWLTQLCVSGTMVTKGDCVFESSLVAPHPSQGCCLQWNMLVLC